MKLIRFIISNIFFKNMIYLICLTLLLAIMIFFGLGFVTQHNKYVTVPKLFGLHISEAIESAKKNP